MSKPVEFETDLDFCRQREAEEREAGVRTDCSDDKDAHLMLAERYADRAWSLEEANDAPYRPSGLWAAVKDMLPSPRAEVARSSQ